MQCSLLILRHLAEHDTKTHRTIHGESTEHDLGWKGMERKAQEKVLLESTV